MASHPRCVRLGPMWVLLRLGVARPRRASALCRCACVCPPNQTVSDQTYCFDTGKHRLDLLCLTRKCTIRIRFARTGCQFHKTRSVSSQRPLNALLFPNSLWKVMAIITRKSFSKTTYVCYLSLSFYYIGWGCVGRTCNARWAANAKFALQQHFSYQGSSDRLYACKASCWRPS